MTGPSHSQASEPGHQYQDHMRRWEGQLNKFTNVVKGWQYRWFVLEPATGTIECRGGNTINVLIFDVIYNSMDPYIDKFD